MKLQRWTARRFCARDSRRLLDLSQLRVACNIWWHDFNPLTHRANICISLFVHRVQIYIARNDREILVYFTDIYT